MHIIVDPSTLKQRALSTNVIYINTCLTSYPSVVHGGAEVGGLRYTSDQIDQDLSVTRFVVPEPSNERQAYTAYWDSLGVGGAKFTRFIY